MTDIEARVAAELRRRGIDLEGRRLLLTRFSGTSQERDLTLPPNCGGFGRLHHFRLDQGPGWPPNPLPIVPAASALNVPVEPMVLAQVFQSAVCSWRCWYCFVDYKLLKGDSRYAEFKSANDVLTHLVSDKDAPRIIDLSGGQPDLFPEWPVWFLEELAKRGLEGRYYLWSDDNLSNDFLWQYLSSAQIELLARSKFYGRVGCFKGFDSRSFHFNTKAPAERFESQFKIMRRLIDTGMNVFGYVTLTSDDPVGVRQKVDIFVDKLQNLVGANFPLRVVPLRIRVFNTMADRLDPSSFQRVMDIQDEAAAAWMEIVQARFGSQTPITLPNSGTL